MNTDSLQNICTSKKNRKKKTRGNNPVQIGVRLTGKSNPEIPSIAIN